MLSNIRLVKLIFYSKTKQVQDQGSKFVLKANSRPCPCRSTMEVWWEWMKGHSIGGRRFWYWELKVKKKLVCRDKCLGSVRGGECKIVFLFSIFIFSKFYLAWSIILFHVTLSLLLFQKRNLWVKTSIAF